MLRPYNSETDYQVIVESVKKINGQKSLTQIASDLVAAGIEWPSNFNSSRTPTTVALDRDICKAWGV